MELTAQRCRELLSYRDGILYWRVAPSSRVKVKIGDIAGCPLANGYWHIKIAGRTYKRHRLVWLIHHGDWPEHQIDHINRVPGDDRIENLRDATPSQNQWNRDARGIRFKDGGWEATIKAHYKVTYLGRRGTETEARALYLEARHARRL